MIDDFDVPNDDTQMKATPSHTIVGNHKCGQETIAPPLERIPLNEPHWRLSRHNQMLLDNQNKRVYFFT